MLSICTFLRLGCFIFNDMEWQSVSRHEFQCSHFLENFIISEYLKIQAAKNEKTQAVRLLGMVQLFNIMGDFL